jgi:hypothetical protein
MSLSEKWASGYPDLLCIKMQDFVHLPVYMFIELKSPTGKVSKIQEYTFNVLRSLGCVVHIVNDIKQMDEILEKGGNKL